MVSVNEIIKSAKYKILDHVESNGDEWWNIISFFTKASDVVMGDGTDDNDTLESRLGNIKGISSDLSCKDSEIVASMKILHQLNNWLPEVTLPAGETSVVIEDESITENSIIDIYYSDTKVNVEETGEIGKLTITLNSALETDITIRCKVTNIY